MIATDVTPLGTIEVRNQTFPVSVAFPSGRFMSVIDGAQIQADTIDALRGLLMTATRKAAVKLTKRIIEVDRGGTHRHGVIEAIHGGTGNPMIRWEGSRKCEQESSLYGALDADKLTEAQITRLIEIGRAVAKLDAESYALRKGAEFSVHKFVRQVTEEADAS